jgi:hypothetical protein
MARVASLQRYDLAANAWTTLAPMPAAATIRSRWAIGGDGLCDRGQSPGLLALRRTAFRYIVSENRWESIAQLPNYIAAGAASLGGFAYFASGAPAYILQYDPRTARDAHDPGRRPRAARPFADGWRSRASSGCWEVATSRAAGERRVDLRPGLRDLAHGPVDAGRARGLRGGGVRHAGSSSAAGSYHHHVRPCAR